MFQDYAKALLPWRTAAGNVVAGAGGAGHAARRARRPASPRCWSASASRASSDKYPAQMSGGMQQRLQIARCLAQEPAALMMDEPFGALDAMTRQGLQDEMLDIARATGATILFVTHDLEEAIYLGDRVIGLAPHPGRIGIEIAGRPAAPARSGRDAREPGFPGAAPPALRFHPRRRERAAR